MVENILQGLYRNCRTQKRAEQAFIDLEAKAELATLAGNEPEISKEEADRLAHKSLDLEVNIQSAIKQYETLRRFVITPVLKKVLMIDLQPYAYADIQVSKSPKSHSYHDLASKVAEEGSQISCGVVYNEFMFDPQYSNNWKELCIQRDNMVRLYLRNHGEHELETFAKYIGDIVKKDDKFSAQKVRLPKNAREFEITNQYGLHARPAALFVKTASRFDCDTTVEKDGNKVSGTSIMSLLTLEITNGSRIIVKADGPEAQDCLDELQALIVNKFDEN